MDSMDIELESETLTGGGGGGRLTLGGVLKGDHGRHFRVGGWTIVSMSMMIAALVVVVVALAIGRARPGNCGASAPSGDATGELASFVASTLDPGADPCHDFYQYACGGWLAATEVPPSKTSVSLGFSVIRDVNQDVIVDILEEDWPVIGPYYRACMDLDGMDARGVDAPLAPLMAAIDAMSGESGPKTGMWAAAGSLRAMGVDALVSAGIYGDEKSPEVHVVYVTAPPAGLPDRDYYLDPALRAKHEHAYKAHMARMLGFAGVEAGAAAAAAESFWAYEAYLANVSLPRAELRDPDRTYNRMTVAQLDDLAGPDVDVASFLRAWGLGGDVTATEVVVTQPQVYAALGSAVANLGDEGPKLYLKWRVLTNYATLLTRAVREENFDFYSRKLYGQQEMRERNQTCARSADSMLTDVINRYWVERKFPSAAKAEAVDMVERIEAAFDDNLATVPWLDGPTAAAAREKLSMMSNLIGYPDRWRHYPVYVAPDNHFANVFALIKHEVQRSLAKLAQPVDRGEWFMTPSEVNAYYDPSENQMVFPAGIIQPTFFKHEYPPSFNYGGIGAVMGHELSHGFDDQGRRYDGTGRLTSWWPQGVVDAFTDHAQCVAREYSGFEVTGDISGDVLGKVNGNLTLGENLADIVGVKMAYRAWERRSRELGGDRGLRVPVAAPGGGGGGQVVDLSPEQLFFVSFAETWCSKKVDEAAANRILTDPHSPARWRVNGSLRNTRSFAEAFGCVAGRDQMAPQDVCRVW